MSDEPGLEPTEEQEPKGTEEEPEKAPEEPTEKGEEEFDSERAKAALRKKNNENASLRKRLKELEPLASKAKELEDAQKSESEKLNEAKVSAEKRATDAERDVARLEVALDKGLTKVQAKRLVGETAEELEADADELLASFKPSEADDEEDEGQEPDPKRRPKERLRPGAAPSAEPEDNDPAALASKVKRDW